MQDDLIRRPDGTYIRYDDAKPRDQLAHDLVVHHFPAAEEEEVRLRQIKRAVLNDMRGYEEMMFQDYEMSVAGREGGFSLKSLCGTKRIELSVAKHLSFGPEIKVAEALLKEFLQEELKGSSEAIREVFSDAFKLNAKGCLDTAGILGLRKHRFDHPTWKQAMDAIDDALCRDSSTVYIRFYRIDTDTKVQTLVPLDLAKV